MSTTIAKGLTEFVNPYKQPKFTKQILTQMKEIEGKQPFGQGYYHNNHYENLIKSLLSSRTQYRQSKDIQQRKQLADQEYQQWNKYISTRLEELPEEFQFNEKMAYDLKQSFDVFVRRNEKEVQPKFLLDILNDYTKVHQFNIPIDNWCIVQMIHFHMGYLLNLNRLLPFNDLKRLITIKTLATYEKSLGQDLLFKEICSYGYWEMFQQSQGYMNVAEFSSFMQIFKFQLQPNLQSILKEFRFGSNLFQGEFSKDIDPKQEIIRFDFFRYLFLERNL